MKCDEVLNLLDPLVDQELPDREQDAVRLHLDRCPTCQRELHQINELRKMLKQAPRHAVPESLMNNVSTLIANADGQGAPALNLSSWMKPMATHAAAAVVGALFFYGAFMPSSEPPTQAGEIVAAHVRSLMDERLTQVRTSDTHTVAPWFAGKIDFAPSVSDLSADGFPLLGGRIDYLQDRKVAALVYLRRKHRINLFVSPSTGKPSTNSVQWSRNGYNIVGWHHKNFEYWAISDLNLNELIAFSNLLVAM